MRTVHMLDPDHAPIRWAHLVETKKNRENRGPDFTRMPNGWFVYDGPRLVTVHTFVQGDDGAHLTGTEKVDHASLLKLLWDRMGDIATNEVTANGGAWTPELASEYTVLSAAFDLIESDLDTGGSLASWRGPREMVDLALTLAITDAGDPHFVQTEWEEF